MVSLRNQTIIFEALYLMKQNYIRLHIKNTLLLIWMKTRINCLK